MSETFDLEYVNAAGCEVVTELNKQQLDVLLDAGAVKLSDDHTTWLLNEGSEHYNVALALLSIGDED